MNGLTRGCTIVAALLLFPLSAVQAQQPATSTLPAATTAAAAPTQPTKQWVWLTNEKVWGYGYQMTDGPEKGLWKIDEGSRRAPTTNGSTTTTAAAAPAQNTGDPYGFVAIMNQYRARSGLGPVAYDANLSAWASQNNAAQSRRGLGHYVIPNCLQNSGWNYGNAASAAMGWMNSSAHRATMLSAAITRVGIAYGPGPYWTLNAQ